MNTRVVLAYSGGSQSSAAISSLIESERAEVVAVAVDLGQGDDLAEVRQRALSAGAVRCHVVDAREEFARDFIVPTLRSSALLEGRFPMPTALGRAVIAKTLATIARIEDARTVAHAGSETDHLRLSGALRAIDHALKVVACAETSTPGQPKLSQRQHRVTSESGLHIDQNLWGRTIGRWADAEASELPESAYAITRSPHASSAHDAVVEIEFSGGTPIALNGVAMPPAELIESLTTIGAQHGVGRLSRVKARDGSRLSQVIYEAPAAVLLHTAHDDLQRSTAPGAVQRFVPTVSSAYVELIDRGEWFSNLRPALDAFVNHIQRGVSGVVRLKLFKGVPHVHESASLVRPV